MGCCDWLSMSAMRGVGVGRLMTHMLWIYRPCYRIKAKLLNKAEKAFIALTLTNLLASPLAPLCCGPSRCILFPEPPCSFSPPCLFSYHPPALQCLPPFPWLLHIVLRLSLLSDHLDWVWSFSFVFAQPHVPRAMSTLITSHHNYLVQGLSPMLPTGLGAYMGRDCAYS